MTQFITWGTIARSVAIYAVISAIVLIALSSYVQAPWVQVLDHGRLLLSSGLLLLTAFIVQHHKPASRLTVANLLPVVAALAWLGIHSVMSLKFQLDADRHFASDMNGLFPQESGFTALPWFASSTVAGVGVVCILAGGFWLRHQRKTRQA